MRYAHGATMTKIAFLCSPGLDSFIKQIVTKLSDDYETNLVVSADLSEIASAIHNADIVWLEWGNELAIHVTQKMLDFLAGKKVILRLHSYEALSGFVPQIAWNQIDALICVADHIRDLVTAQFAIAQELGEFDVENFPVYTIPNGVDMQQFPFAEREKGFDLAYLGDINFKKGPMLLFHAFQRLAQSNNKYKLHIAGTFQEPRYDLYFQQMTKKLKLEKNIIRYGRIDDPGHWLNTKDYIVNSSVLEGHPVGIAEAMAMGIKPVVHNFYGAEGLYRKEHLWSTISQFISSVKSDKYDSQSYRNYVVEKNWTLEAQIKSIKEVIEDLTVKNTLKSNTPERVKVPMKSSNELRVNKSVQPSENERVIKETNPTGDIRVNPASESTKHERVNTTSEPRTNTRVKPQAKPIDPLRTPADDAIQWIKNNSIHVDITNVKAIAVSNKNKIAYPEVTGYLIPTLLNFREEDLAKDYLNYLTAYQTKDGFFMAPRRSEGEKIGIVFDTAQALRGLNAFYPKYKGLEDAIRKACDWLIESANNTTKRWPVPEGSTWNMGDRGIIPEHVHLYCLPPIWEAGKKFGRSEYILFAMESVKSYAADMYVKEIGWDNKNMLLHFFGYIIEALIDLGRDSDAHIMLGDLTKELGQDIYIPAYSDVTWICTPGLAQMAICYAKLDMMGIANDILDHLVKNYQKNSGGFDGSYGIDADYFPNEEISWAVKFFLDAWYLIRGSYSQDENHRYITSQTMGENHVTRTSQRKVETQSDHTSQQKLENQIEPTSPIKDENQNVNANQTSDENHRRIMSQSKDENHAKLASHSSHETHSLFTNLSPDAWAKTLSAGLAREQIVHKIESRDYSIWAKFILDNTKKGDKVLELGSGTGEISGHLAYADRIVTLLDFSQEMLDFSEDIFKGFLSANFYKADVIKPFAFNTDTFDVVFSVGLLEHFGDEIIVQILKNASRVCKGQIISLVPNALSVPYMMGKSLQEQAGTWKWGLEDPKTTLHPHYLKAGVVVIKETTIAPFHALRFVDEHIAQAFLKWYEKMSEEELTKRKQGYLLATIGAPITSQKDHEIHNNDSTSQKSAEIHSVGMSQAKVEPQESHTNQRGDESQQNPVIHPENENQNNDVSQDIKENQHVNTSQPTNEDHESITSQVCRETQAHPTKKTLVVIPNDPLEAYEKAGYPDLTEYFNPQGYFDKVYCLMPWDQNDEDKFGMEVIPLHPKGVYYNWLEKFATIIRAYDFRAAYALMQFTGIPENIPFIVSVHDDNPARFIDVPADHYIAMSQKVKIMLTGNMIPENKITVMPNRIDTSIFKPVNFYMDVPLEITANVTIHDKKMILCIGRWSEQKNQDTLMKALEILGPKYFGVIIGQGEKQVPPGGVEIHAIDHVPNEQLPQWYSLCDCFCLPSRWEGFGTVFIEAMACGALVITSGIPPMTEYIQHNFNGFTIPEYENENAVAETIQHVCESLEPNIEADIRLNATETAQKFSKLEIDTQEVEIYKSLMK